LPLVRLPLFFRSVFPPCFFSSSFALVIFTAQKHEYKDRRKDPLPESAKKSFQKTLTAKSRGLEETKQASPRKDFIKTNALAIINATPKKVDNEKLQYTKKPDYGMEPEYLKKVKEEIAKETGLFVLSLLSPLSHHHFSFFPFRPSCHFLLSSRIHSQCGTTAKRCSNRFST
jgi:hypothetical protein